MYDLIKKKQKNLNNQKIMRNYIVQHTFWSQRICYGNIKSNNIELKWKNIRFYGQFNIYFTVNDYKYVLHHTKKKKKTIFKYDNTI